MFKLCFDFVRNKETIKATYYNTAWHGGCFLQLICFFSAECMDWWKETVITLNSFLFYWYTLFIFSILVLELLTKNLVDIMINIICIIWYSWLVYPWVTLPISMGHIKLKAFFLGHWSIAISYRCRLDRTFIYNTRTQLKAQKSIMEMLDFFRNILRYATLEIFNLWMNDGNKTNFLRQIKYTSIFKWAIQMQ